MVFSGLSRIHILNGISIGSSVFAVHTVMTNRHTKETDTEMALLRHSIRRNGPHSDTAAMRPNNVWTTIATDRVNNC